MRGRGSRSVVAGVGESSPDSEPPAGPLTARGWRLRLAPVMLRSEFIAKDAATALSMSSLVNDRRSGGTAAKSAVWPASKAPTSIRLDSRFMVALSVSVSKVLSLGGASVNTSTPASVVTSGKVAATDDAATWRVLLAITKLSRRSNRAPCSRMTRVLAATAVCSASTFEPSLSQMERRVSVNSSMRCCGDGLRRTTKRWPVLRFDSTDTGVVNAPPMRCGPPAAAAAAPE
mmetsp:Transcript_38685/g.79050  ORF Transcript_38685/g.79050 Transcript_38685/m.79050 type:complete len:231 (-) Transcript_38685:467-1159(-)